MIQTAFNGMITLLMAKFILNDLPHMLNDSSSSDHKEIDMLIPRYPGGPPVPKLVYRVGVSEHLRFVPFRSEPTMTELHYIDSYIRWAVLAVDALNGIKTTDSCQGHPEIPDREELTSTVKRAIRNKALGANLASSETAYVGFIIRVDLVPRVKAIAEAEFGKPQMRDGRPVYSEIEGDYLSELGVSGWSQSPQHHKGGHVAVMYVANDRRPSFFEWHANKDRLLARLIKILYSAVGEDW